MRKYNNPGPAEIPLPPINGIWWFHYKNYFCEKLKAAIYRFKTGNTR
jgi:hypothetical protein